MGGTGAVNINRAEDRARLAGRSASARQQAAEDGATDHGVRAAQQASAAPARVGRQWGIRVHWGIVFALVASFVLWFAIKTVFGLVF